MKKSLASYSSYCNLLRQWRGVSVQVNHSTASTHTILQGRGRVNNLNLCNCTLSSGRVATSPGIGQDSLLQCKRLFSSLREEEEVDEELEETVPSVPLNHEKPNIQARFRTKHNDPTKHSIEDEGLFYRVPAEDYEKYIKVGQWNGYQKQVKTFQECAVMVRRPALEAREFIDSANLDYPPIKLLLYGKNGSGKTMTLAHLVHCYAKQGWLTIHLPHMLSWLRFQPTKTRPFDFSSYKENRYDYTEDAMNWLIYFKAQNKHILKDMKTSKKYVWSQRETSPEGTELLQIVDFGISRMKYASDCIGVVFREIKLQAADKGLKVLVAVDGVNGFWKDTTIKDEQKQRVNAQDVSTFKHFQNLFNADWTRGVCVGTVCACIDVLDTKVDREEVPYTPQSLLKKQGFEFMDPFIPILVPNYSIKEAHNCIDYFIERKWIIKPRGLTEEGKKELMMISNRNPYQLMAVTAHW